MALSMVAALRKRLCANVVPEAAFRPCNATTDRAQPFLASSLSQSSTCWLQGSLGSVRVLAALGGRLFGGLFRRADAISAAMTARGFAGVREAA